eukprot:3177687-Pleurochrysis_carterae.AAC.1
MLSGDVSGAHQCVHGRLRQGDAQRGSCVRGLRDRHASRSRGVDACVWIQVWICRIVVDLGTTRVR